MLRQQYCWSILSRLRCHLCHVYLPNPAVQGVSSPPGFARRPPLARSHTSVLSSRHLPGGRPRCAKGALRPQAAACAASVVESPTVHASNGNSASSEEPASAAAGPPIGSGPTFQEAVLRLSQYWAERADCIIYMPTNTEVGAGTMNPLGTFLRVLGPEPWKVVYMEPSVRQDDSRYGQNPNRLSCHHQMQVILKPDPGNPVELYLGSLEALGIDTRANDVRLVEDDWKSPALGANGLGWEIWLNGQEISQFTYFQQAGGVSLPVPAVEITYGLERILMAVQRVQHFKDIRFNQQVTYGEMFLEREYQNSVYYLEEADIQAQRQLFSIYKAEAKRLLDRKLPVPAYDQLLKLSASFNLLDARGSVSVTERADCFATMRSFARTIAKMWTAKREELGHPLGMSRTSAPVPSEPAGEAEQPALGEREDFVLEVGCEELPPDDLSASLRQLSSALPGLLKNLQLQHGEIQVEGTPRRISIMIASLATRQKQETERLRGPPLKAAFTADGQTTKALQGFARKNRVGESKIMREGDHIWADVQTGGLSAYEVLQMALPGLLASLSFSKSMRWQAKGKTTFARPVRWLLTLHGSSVVPLSFAGLQAGRTTRLLRTAAVPVSQIQHAAEYRQQLQQQGITLGVQQRQHMIWAAIGDVARYYGGYIKEEYRGDLLAEVAHLVECPTIVGGSFSPDFLSIPAEILTTVMRKHQRYFPVSDAAGHLLPCFVTVANGHIDAARVSAGNEAVIRARFEDALFFYREDLELPLSAYRPKLAGMLFHKDLGTLLDKSDRVEALVGPLAIVMGLPQQAADTAAQGAHLARADLGTSVVTELTSLAGVVGRHYALQSGVASDVALTILERSQPRFAGDTLPDSQPGCLLAVADHIDSLVGLFAAGCAPTATADPYGLRRNANALLQVLLNSGMRLDLRAAIAEAVRWQPLTVSVQAQSHVLDFICRRLEQQLVDGGVQIEVVRAILNERGHDPALAAASAHDLAAELQGSRLSSVLTTMSRPVRLVRSQPDMVAGSVNAELFEGHTEHHLYHVVEQLRPEVKMDMTVPAFLQVCEGLSEPIHEYFDKVFVMCEDEQIRKNRLSLLASIAKLSTGILDFAEMPGF